MKIGAKSARMAEYFKRMEHVDKAAKLDNI